MSKQADVKERSLPRPARPMVIHARVEDAKGMGKRDKATGRYMPVSGGSRTRLPVSDDPKIPRYQGFIGVNASQSEEIFTLPTLYAELGGMREVKMGEASKLAELVAERRPTEEPEASTSLDDPDSSSDLKPL